MKYSVRKAREMAVKAAKKKPIDATSKTPSAEDLALRGTNPVEHRFNVFKRKFEGLSASDRGLFVAIQLQLDQSMKRGEENCGCPTVEVTPIPGFPVTECLRWFYAMYGWSEVQVICDYGAELCTIALHAEGQP